MLIRPLLFALDPEFSHNLAISALTRLSKSGSFLRLLHRSAATPEACLAASVMGLRFANPLGLAAGFDKHATAFPALGAMGFGYVEVGTVTPEPQPGNPAKRMFRLQRDLALINRMGFNSVGLNRVVANLRAVSCPTPLGVNLGKNAATPIEQATQDYLKGLVAVYPHTDYVAINVSSPNTESLRELQKDRRLDRLLSALTERRTELSDRHKRFVPIALKIAPDLSDYELAHIADRAVRHRLDAIIATNTTVQRSETLRSRSASEGGGLSGRPLKPLATLTIGKLYRELKGELPIIGVGGIETAEDAWEKLVAGADLLQLYTSFVFRGPEVVNGILSGLATRVKSMHSTDIASAVRQLRSH